MSLLVGSSQGIELTGVKCHLTTEINGDERICRGVVANMTNFLEGRSLAYRSNELMNSIVLNSDNCKKLSTFINNHPLIIVVPNDWNRTENRSVLIAKEYILTYTDELLVAKVSSKALDMLQTSESSSIKLLGVSQMAYNAINSLSKSLEYQETLAEQRKERKRAIERESEASRIRRERMKEKEPIIVRSERKVSRRKKTSCFSKIKDIFCCYCTSSEKRYEPINR